MQKAQTSNISPPPKNICKITSSVPGGGPGGPERAHQDKILQNYAPRGVRGAPKGSHREAPGRILADVGLPGRMLAALGPPAPDFGRFGASWAGFWLIWGLRGRISTDLGPPGPDFGRFGASRAGFRPIWGLPGRILAGLGPPGPDFGRFGASRGGFWPVWALPGRIWPV